MVRLGRGLFSTAALLLVGISMGWGVSEIATDASRTGVSSDRRDTPSQVAKSPAPQAQYVVDNQLLQFDREIPAALLELQRQGKIRLESIDGIVPITYEDGTRRSCLCMSSRSFPHRNRFSWIADSCTYRDNLFHFPAAFRSETVP